MLGNYLFSSTQLQRVTYYNKDQIYAYDFITLQGCCIESNIVTGNYDGISFARRTGVLMWLF
jgi:hypothetical protein